MKAIEFNQKDIEAILNGSKTMTRRPIKFDNITHRIDFTSDTTYEPDQRHKHYKKKRGYTLLSVTDFIDTYAKYKIGEIVFIQEEFEICEDETGNVYTSYKPFHNKHFHCEWYNSSEMQEHQARIFLKITNIKVERLQDISEEDCIKEGVIRGEYATDDGDAFMYLVDNSVATYYTPQSCFEKEIWNNLPYQTPYDWNINPYVFVYEFEVAK